MMKTTYTPSDIVSVEMRDGDRQAYNLSAAELPEVVRPWFEDWADSDIRKAIAALGKPESRSKAARFLGLELCSAA